MSTVYVTGGSGFLGRQIVRFARELGHHVLAPRSSVCDLALLDSLESWLQQQREAGSPVDTIVHSAAYYGGLNITLSEPATIFATNVRMINHVFEAAVRAGVRKVVAVGSACAYPGDIQGDMGEDDFWSGGLHPSVEAYGFTKKVQLVAQNAYHKQHGLEGNHLVLTNLYGPHDVFTEYRGHAISVLIKRYVDAAEEGLEEVSNWGDGSAVREFMYVEDAGRLLAAFIDSPHDLTPVNVGTGVGTAIGELTERITEYSGFSGRVRWDTSKPNGVPRKVLDVSRLQALMPECRLLALGEGLKRTIKWYKTHKDDADRAA